MVKRLTKHGNSMALVIDRPILELLNIDSETPLEISTDGKQTDHRAGETIEAPEEVRGRPAIGAPAIRHGVPGAGGVSLSIV